MCYNFPANAGYALFIKAAERKPHIFYLPLCSPVLVRSSQDLYKHHCLIFRLRSEFGILLFSFISLSTGVDRQKLSGTLRAVTRGFSAFRGLTRGFKHRRCVYRSFSANDVSQNPAGNELDNRCIITTQLQLFDRGYFKFTLSYKFDAKNIPQ